MNRPQKVLHILNSAGGGAALSTLSLIDHLKAQGIASAAVCHDAGTAEERRALQEAVDGEVLFMRLYWWNRKIRTPAWRRPLVEARQIVATGWSLGSAARVAEAAQRWHADLIHTNTILVPEGGRAARTLGLPHVWHLRELLGPGHPFRLTREGPAFGRYMAHYCSKLVANSQTSAELIRDWLPNNLLAVVPNGIDLARFAARPEPTNGRISIGMVGNLTSRSKKHALFIEAASLVDPSLPIQWRIYGHDPSQGGAAHGDSYINELHAQVARLNLGDRLRFAGFHSDPARIMSEIDVLVHPADNESFGRVVVEAMAASLPVVGMRGGGVAEIVLDGETGLLSEPDNARDLAQKIEQLARDPLRCRQFGLAGRQRAEANYSVAACAEGIVRVYEQAMSQPLGRVAPLGALDSHRLN
jgi:glycosyltransferase involved in cell wall biosynthesis